MPRTTRSSTSVNARRREVAAMNLRAMWASDRMSDDSGRDASERTEVRRPYSTRGRRDEDNFSTNGASSDGHGIHFPNNLEGEKLFEEVGKIIVENLPEPSDGVDQKDVFDSLETGVVLAALRRTNGNKQAAANLLGLYRPRLYGMIKRHNLEEKI